MTRIFRRKKLSRETLGSAPARAPCDWRPRQFRYFRRRLFCFVRQSPDLASAYASRFPLKTCPIAQKRFEVELTVPPLCRVRAIVFSPLRIRA
jgi:hypothetical protein